MVESAKEVYNLILAWDSEAGEDFIEYYIGNESNINVREFLQWANSQGFYPSDKLNNLESSSDIDYEHICGYEEPLALFENGEGEEKPYFKSLWILAHYISEDKERTKVLEDFVFDGAGWTSFSSEEDKEGYRKNVQSAFEYISKYPEDELCGFDIVAKWSVEEINKECEL